MLSFDEIKNSQLTNPAQYGQQGQVLNMGAITPESLTPATLTPFVQPAPTAIPDVANLFTTPPLTATPEEKQAQGISDRLMTLNDQLVGKSSYQNQQETNFGVDKTSGTLNDLNAQLIGLKNEQAAIPLLLEKNASSQGIASPIIDRQRTSLLRDNAIQALSVSAMMAASQGQLANAQGLADRAVATKYGPIQEQISAAKNNLEIILNSPNYTIAQKNRAQAQLDIQNKKLDALKEQKDNANQINQIALEAAASGADAATLKKIQGATTPIQAAEAAAVFGKQQTNIQLAQTVGVNTKFVNKNGEFFNTATGKAYETPQDFFRDAGVASFDEAYQKGLISDVNNSTLANQDLIAQAQAKYLDVVIPKNATPEQISQIIKGSRIYQDQVRGPVGNGPTGLAGANIIDANTDAAVKNLIASNIKNGYGNAYNAVKAKFGEAVANSYDKVYQDVFNKGASVDAAFNNLKLSSSPTVKLTPAQISTTINQIAGSFDNEAIVKQYNVINEGYQFAKSLDNNTNNPSDDQGLIYAFAKAMDPGSVVREGEYATVQKYSQSWVKAYGKGVEQAVNGTGFLSSEARANIKKTIEARYNASKTNYDNVYNQYQQRINDAKAGKGNSVTDYSQAYSSSGGQIIEYNGKQYQTDADGNFDPNKPLN